MKMKLDFFAVGILILLVSCKFVDNKLVSKKIDSVIVEKSTLHYGLSEKISDFIPKDYEVLRLIKGNLNLDSINDYILVLKRNSEESISTSENPLKRLFMIITVQKDSSYILSSSNENALYFYGYDGNFKDALTEISIKNGNFLIEHYGGFAKRWTRTISFMYSPDRKNWYLHQDNYTTFDARDTQKGSEEKTKSIKDFGEIAFSDFDIYKK